MPKNWLDALGERAFILRAGAWVLPGAGGTYDPLKPTMVVEGSTWAGPWGLSGTATIFNTTYVPFRATPYFAGGTPLFDVLLRRRIDAGAFQLLAGYRGLGIANVNFLSAGIAGWRPLPISWLRLEARALGGHNLGFGGSRSFAEGQALLTAHEGPYAFSLGFRHLSMFSTVEPVVNVSGPLVQVRADF